jgi:hypothetical protein
MTQVSTGTVIHGTLRQSDLLVAFRDELSRILDERGENSESYPQGRLVQEASLLLGYSEQEIEYGEKAELASEVIAALIDALDEEAPEGLYFGAIEGDGSDFGFWPVPPEEVT